VTRAIGTVSEIICSIYWATYKPSRRICHFIVVQEAVRALQLATRSNNWSSKLREWKRP